MSWFSAVQRGLAGFIAVLSRLITVLLAAGQFRCAQRSFHCGAVSKCSAIPHHVLIPSCVYHIRKNVFSFKTVKKMTARDGPALLINSSS